MSKPRFRDDPLGPIELIAVFLIAFILIGIVPQVLSDVQHYRSQHPDACALTDPAVEYYGKGQAVSVKVEHGQTATSAALRFCEAHPSTTQRLLAVAPSYVSETVLLGFAVLIELLTRRARRDGYFSKSVADGLTLLGAVVLLGAAVERLVDVGLRIALIRSIGQSEVHLNPFGLNPSAGILLAGAALLTFGRVMRHAVRMREELDATV